MIFIIPYISVNTPLAKNYTFLAPSHVHISPTHCLNKGRGNIQATSAICETMKCKPAALYL